MSCLVGVLAALCIAEVLQAGFERKGEVSDAVVMCDLALRLLRECMRRASRALDAAEEWLCGRGVITPRRRAQRSKVERAMPEAFNSLAVSLGSGLSLAQAMQYVGSRAEEPVHTEFLHASSLMACGVSASEALDELVGRLDAPGLGMVVLALKISRRTGAPLGGLLADAAHLVEERIALARGLEVKTAQVRMSARMVAGMPVLMIAFLSLVSGDFRSGVFTVAGAGSVVVAIVLNVLAWLIIRQVMKVDW